MLKMKAVSLALAVALGSVALVGCDSAGKNESYTGVPKNGQTCKEFYQVPANQVKCTNADSRH